HRWLHPAPSDPPVASGEVPCAHGLTAPRKTRSTASIQFADSEASSLGRHSVLPTRTRACRRGASRFEITWLRVSTMLAPAYRQPAHRCTRCDPNRLTIPLLIN